MQPIGINKIRFYSIQEDETNINKILLTKIKKEQLKLIVTTLSTTNYRLPDMLYVSFFFFFIVIIIKNED